MIPISPLMDSTQVAGLLKCSERTVEDHARAGRLPAVKFGDGWMFPTDALLRAVNRLAEEEAAKRSGPTRPAAIKQAKCKTRPDLTLLLSANMGIDRLPQAVRSNDGLAGRWTSATNDRTQPFQTVGVDLGPEVRRQADGSLH